MVFDVSPKRPKNAVYSIELISVTSGELRSSQVKLVSAVSKPVEVREDLNTESDTFPRQSLDESA